MVYLSELESSLCHLLLVVGATLVIPSFMHPERRRSRTVLFAISILLSIRYIWWRATQTIAPFGLTADCLLSWTFLGLEAAALASSVSAFTIMMKKTNRSAEVERYRGWWSPSPAPRVAILVATYNEDRTILERTIVGAKASDHPNIEVCYFG